MRKLTLLIISLFVTLGVMAQTATLEVSTNVRYPEYQYQIKNGNNIWMAASTAPTQNNKGRFAFFAAGGENAYKIYSIDRQEWVSYDKSSTSDNCKDFATFVAAQDEANAWKITSATSNGQDVYQIQPYNNDGTVTARYWNWNAGVGEGGGYGYNYDDGKTIGLWRDNAVQDDGSAWVLVDYVEAGYYTIACGEKYVSDDKKSAGETQRVLTTGKVTSKNIFYFDGNALIGFASGCGFEYACCNTGKEGPLNFFTFYRSTTSGEYLIKSSDGNSTAGWANGYWKANDGNYLERVDKENASLWTLTPVTMAAQIGEQVYYTFEDALAAAQAGETITLLADVTCTEKPVFNNGGVVNVDINGHILVSNEQGRIRNVVSADGQVASNNIKFVSGFGWEVYSGNGVEGANFRVFPTLNEAVAYIPASDRVARIYLYENIKLENDVTLRKYSGGTSSTICVDPGYEITLNLNGYTVLQESPTGNPLEACIRGSLVLDDTSEAKTGKWIAGACGVTDKSNSWYGNGGPAFYVLGDGELILKGGAVSIARNTSMNSNGEPVVNTGGLIRLDSGSLTVDGATLQCDDTYGVMAWGGNVVVNSGEFVLGENGYYSVFASKYYADASVEVNKAIDGYLLISSTATATVNVPGVKYVANGTDYVAPAVGEGLIALDGQVYVPAVDVPENVVGNIVSNNSGNSNVTEDAVTAIVNGLYNNGDVIKYVPTNIPDGAKLVVELKNVIFESASAVPATVVYDVTPKNGDAEVEPTEEITFRLPVPESWAGKYTKVYHSGIALEGLYPVQEGNYVEVASQDFSEFAVETVDYIVLPDGVNSSNYAAKFGDNTVTDGTNYYATLQAAVEAVVGQANAVLYCKPGADVGSLQHAPVTSTLTVYGNGADVTGGAERDFDLGNTDPSFGNDITADMTLTVKHLNGCGAWGAKATEHTVDLVFENCANMGKVFITGTTGTLNITMTDCAFEGVINEAVYSNADGAITLTNVAFSNLNKAVNLNHKAAGTQTVTIDGCTFTNCGADVAADQIPVRVLSSVEGGKSVLAVTGSTFTGTPEGGADILLDYGVGLTTASVSGTAANVVVEKENNVGTTTAVKAEETVEFTTALPVAQIGETKYMTLQAAVEAATEGATITMLGDVTLTETVTIPADKTVIIDLNGKTVTRQDEATEYAINNLGTLTIQDTKGNGSINARGIYNGYGNGGANVATAKITVLSGTINAKGTNGGGAAIFNYGVADIQGGTFTSVASYAIALQTGSTMTIGENAIITGGINSWQSTLTITGGTISNDKSGKHVVYAGESAVTINGGTFHNNNSGNATIMASGSTAAVEITGGTFTLNIVDASSSYLIDATSSANYTISGGSFTGGIRAQGGTKYEITGGTFTNEYGNYNVYEGGDINISGGTFTGSYAQKFATDNLADGYELDENGTVVQVNYVAKIDEQGYETLADAVAAAADGAIVTMLSDVELTEAVKVVGKAITLDLNGKTVSGACNSSQGHLVYIENGAGLTVKDGAVDGGGKLTYAQGTSNVGWTVAVMGNLTLESGTIELTGEWSIGYAVDVRPNAWGVAYTAPSVFTMNGGNVVSSDGAVRVASSSSDIYADVSASFVMNGGEIDAAWDGVFIQQSNAAYDVLNFTINDGTIKGGLNPVRVYGPAPTSYVNGQKCMSINFNGGTMTYTGTETREWVIDGVLRVGGGSSMETIVENGNITAGEAFAQAQALPDGYKWEQDGETYKVVEVPAIAKVGEQGYASLADAVAAAEGETVTLLADVELTESLVIAAGKEVTLDLNGKTVSMADASGKGAYAIKNNGDLTIVDNSDAKTGKITFNSTTPDNSFGYATSTIGNGGSLTVESGTIENTTVGGASYAIDGIWHTDEASLTINGGTIVANKIAVRQVPFSATANNVVTVNGGTLTGATAGLQLFNINNDAKLAEVNIHGGEFNGTYAFYTSFTSAAASEDVTINIDGGEFNGYLYLYNGNNGSDEYPMTVSVTGGTFNGGAYIYTTDANGVEVAIPSITGGTFANDVTDYCAEGFVCEANSDGTYGIVADPSYTAELTIDDAEGANYTNDTEKTVGTLTYKRTLVNGKWNALYLPFEIELTDELLANYDFADYNQMISSDTNGDRVPDSFEMELFIYTSGTLDANYPYFVRPKNEEACSMNLVLTDATLYPANEISLVTSSVKNTFKLSGTYSAMDKAALAGKYAISIDGDWSYTSALKPYRLYLTITDNNGAFVTSGASKSVRIVVRGEDGTTEIEGVYENPTEDMIFDLQGRRVLEPQKGGMYIINGKKVIF